MYLFRIKKSLKFLFYFIESRKINAGFSRGNHALIPPE
jgi:hypothetical protein